MPEMSRLSKAFCTSAPYRAVARRILLRSLQGVRPAGEALEIGTGSGAMAAQLMATFPDVRIVATDYDADMVEVAQKTLATFGDRAAVERADATKLPFEDERFDIVLSFTMLHHVGLWEKAVSEAVRVLRPGGLLVGHDLLDVPPMRWLHIGDPSSTRMIRRGELKEVLAGLPVGDARVREGWGGMVVRFVATRSAPAVGPA